MTFDLTQISPLDYSEVGRALIQAAEKRQKAAQGLKPGVKRDNMMARAIRLKGMGEQLQEMAVS